MGIINVEDVYVGKRIKVRRINFTVNSNLVTKEVVNFGEAAAVLPFLNDDVIIMLKQFRIAVGKWIYEIPAGKVEFGEKPEEAAVRELIEETGYKPGKLSKLVSIYPSPGYSDEIIHIYIAKNLRYEGASPERNELIRVIKIKLDDAFKLLQKKDVIDGKTAIALLYYYKLIS